MDQKSASNLILSFQSWRYNPSHPSKSESVSFSSWLDLVFKNQLWSYFQLINQPRRPVVWDTEKMWLVWECNLENDHRRKLFQCHQAIQLPTLLYAWSLQHFLKYLIKSSLRTLPPNCRNFSRRTYYTMSGRTCYLDSPLIWSRQSERWLCSFVGQSLNRDLETLWEMP